MIHYLTRISLLALLFCNIATLNGNYITPCFAVIAYEFFKSCIKFTKYLLQIINSHLKSFKTNAYLFLKIITEHKPF